MRSGLERRGHYPRQYTILVMSVLLSGVMFTWASAAVRGDAARGQRLYQHYCAVCHGLEGNGRGRNAPSLEHMGRAPRDHTDARYMNRLSDAELYRAIYEGKRRQGEPPFMPWWGYTLTEQDIWDLVAFIRNLSGKSVE